MVCISQRRAESWPIRGRKVFNISLCVSSCLHVYLCKLAMHMHVETKEQLVEVGSPPLPCGSWRWNLNHSVWGQMHLLMEPSQQPIIYGELYIIVTQSAEQCFTGQILFYLSVENNWQNEYVGLRLHKVNSQGATKLL